MTGDPAAAALHELLSAVLRGVRASARPAARAARSRTAMRERRDAFKARILGIAAGYDPRFERLANRIREAADGLVACAACPALPATTHRSEQRMRTFVKDRYAPHAGIRPRQEAVLGRKDVQGDVDGQGRQPCP